MRANILLSIFILASTAACDTVDSGKNHVLGFEWDADSQLVPSAFSTRLAKGTAASVNVYASETDKTAANVVNAASADPSIAEVESTVGNVITLTGVGVGTTEIQVESTAGSDVFDVTVAEIDLIDLSYPGAIAPDDPKSVGMQGGTARFLMTLKDADGHVLIGTGEAVESGITVDPSNGAQLGDPQSIGSLSLVFSTVGPLTITGKKDSALTMDVVADADVTALEWRGIDGLTLTPGTASVAILRGTTASGDSVVGVASLASVTSNDAAICTVTPNARLGEGVYTVSAKGAGECQITASLGERADRATLTIAP